MKTIYPPCENKMFLTQYFYDAAGDLARMVDPVKRETTYKFDARQRLVEENQTTRKRSITI
jgi:YD repeat-containing protein